MDLPTATALVGAIYGSALVGGYLLAARVGWPTVLLLAGAYAARKLYTWRRQPGPFPWPVVGSLFRSILRHHDIYDEQADVAAAQQGKSWAVKLLGMTFVNVVEPACVEHVLRGNFANYEKGEIFRSVMGDLLGSGIFNVDGDEWRVQRKTASYEFSVRKFRDFMADVFAAHADAVHARVAAVAASGEAVDMADLFNRYTLDSIGTIAFGKDIGSLAAAGDGGAFAASFDVATQLTPVRVRSPWWKLARWLDVGREAELTRAVAAVRGFADELIAERHAMAPAERAQQNNLLSRFMALKDPATGQPYSDAYLADTTINFVLAGRDTTADCLCWTFHLLAQNPAAVARMREELAALPAHPGYNDLTGLQYLQALVTESLRLYPSVPADPKEAQGDDVLPDGFVVNKGDWVAYLPYAMGRQEYLWPDALAFRPERHLDAEGRFQQPSPFKFTAFQGGPRTCLGINMAYLEVKYLLARLYRDFDFAPAPGAERRTYQRGTTLRMKGGLPMLVSRRG